MKAYSPNIGKILAKININEHILPIFHQSEKRAKTVKYKESLNINLSKTVCPILAQIYLSVSVSVSVENTIQRSQIEATRIGRVCA